MKKCFLLLVLFSSLASCSFVHKRDIQQGNILTEKNVNALHKGMSKVEVIKIMGHPVLLNTFSDNRSDYVYSYKPAHGQFSEKYITVIFSGNSVKEIKGNMYSHFIK